VKIQSADVGVNLLGALMLVHSVNVEPQSGFSAESPIAKLEYKSWN
jgi:hypothetical protein